VPGVYGLIISRKNSGARSIRRHREGEEETRTLNVGKYRTVDEHLILALDLDQEALFTMTGQSKIKKKSGKV
jgi:hypothetical protein